MSLSVESEYSALCRLLRWGSSTVADLATASSARLDQTWPGLEMTDALKELDPTHINSSGSFPASAQPDVTGTSRSPAGHCLPSHPNALPEGSAGDVITLPQGSVIPSAVHKTGFASPMLPDHTGAVCATPHMALQPSALAWSVVCQPQVPVQAEDPFPADDAESGTASYDAEASQQSCSPSWQLRSAPHRQRQQNSHQCGSKQKIHADTLEGSEARDTEGQLPQILRHRSRLQLAQEAGSKGILSLGKRQFGRVISAKPVRLLTEPKSKVPHLRACSKDDTADYESRSCAESDTSTPPSLASTLPNISKVAAHMPAAAQAAPSRRPSMQTMLQSSLQQVQACSEQLQEQSAQQHHLQRSIEAMTAKTIAMLDHAILAAMNQDAP